MSPLSATRPARAACTALPFIDAGHGPEVVVLLHSSMSSKGQWRALIEQLQTTHRLLAIDLYGYGAAPLPHGLPGFSLSDEASRVHALIDTHLPFNARVHLVGHSYGGAVALKLALSLGARVRSLALFEPTSFHAVPAADAHRLSAVREVAARLCESPGDPRPTAVAGFIDFWNGERSFESLPQERRDALLAVAPKVPLDFQALFDPRCRASDYRPIHAPVLLMGGDRSPACARAVLAALAQVLPRCELHMLPTGHMGPVTHGPLVNGLVGGFLSEAVVMTSWVRAARAPVSERSFGRSPA